MITGMTVRIAIDQAQVDAVTAAAGEIGRLLKASPPWLRWLAAQALEGFQDGVDLTSGDVERVTVGTSELRVHAQLTDQYRLLLAALRAGNGEGGGGVAFPS